MSQISQIYSRQLTKQRNKQIKYKQQPPGGKYQKPELLQYIIKMLSLQQKIMRHAKKQESMTRTRELKQ